MSTARRPRAAALQSGSSEESRALLQRRLGAYFGWVGAVASYLLVSNVAATAAVGPRTGVSAPGMRTGYFALTALCAVIFIVCRRSPLEGRTLRAIDVAGFLC